jgi:hypothetical protein
MAHEKAAKAATNGQGLGSTKWKGCLCKFLDAVDNKIMLIYFLIELVLLK